MPHRSIITFKLEQRILHALMLRTFFLEDIGLFSGKMGVLLALVEYQKRHPQKVYEDFIDELIDHIWAKMHNELSIGFANGLCGIGWGVEFLIHHKIIEGPGIDLCSELDEKIMLTDLQRITDLSLENGLEGLLLYALLHIQNALLQGTTLPFDSRYLRDLHQTIGGLDFGVIGKNMQHYIDMYTNFYLYDKVPTLSFSLETFASGCTITGSDNLMNYPIGVNGGLSGLLLGVKL